MGENICNEATDKGLITKIYKKLLQLNTKINKQHNQQVGVQKSANSSPIYCYSTDKYIHSERPIV